MTNEQICPDCGAQLPPHAPQGICPKCLLKAGLGSESLNAVSATGPSVAGFKLPEPSELAEKFPQLEVIHLLGQGGMGVVYKARQKGLDRFVALKILPPEVATDPSFAERFNREARALASLNHPNIVTVYDSGEVDGLYYFLMEFIDGLNLRQAIQTAELSSGEALAIVPQICDALQYAHEEGVVHRDIKPENVLLDRRGRVKVADFGLAKLLGRAPSDVTLTGSHQVMGSPHYMAPEQWEKPLDVDHRADIYSLGVVFYEMLTGELPLGHFALPSQKVHVKVELDQVVLRALAKEPERRYQHAGDVKTDLEAVAAAPIRQPASLAYEPTQAPAAPPSRQTAQQPADNDVDLDAALSAVQGPAIGLIVVGMMNLLPILGLLCLAAFAFSWDRIEVQSAMLPQPGATMGPLMATIQPGPTVPLGAGGVTYSWLALLPIILLHVPVALLQILGGIKMRRLESHGLATLASIVAMMPCQFGFLVGLPVGIWSLIVLSRSEVKAAFAAGGTRRTSRLRDAAAPSDPSAATSIHHPVDDPELIRDKLRIPAIGLIASGVLNCAFFVVLIVLLSSTGGMIQVFALLLMLLFPLLGLVLILGGLRALALQSYSLVMVAAVLALLPASIVALISLPFGIWMLVVLSRSEVRAAFGRGRGEPEYSGPLPPGKPLPEEEPPTRSHGRYFLVGVLVVALLAVFGVVTLIWLWNAKSQVAIHQRVTFAKATLLYEVEPAPMAAEVGEHAHVKPMNRHALAKMLDKRINLYGSKLGQVRVMPDQKLQVELTTSDARQIERVQRRLEMQGTAEFLVLAHSVVDEAVCMAALQADDDEIHLEGKLRAKWVTIPEDLAPRLVEDTQFATRDKPDSPPQALVLLDRLNLNHHDVSNVFTTSGFNGEQGVEFDFTNSGDERLQILLRTHEHTRSKPERFMAILVDDKIRGVATMKSRIMFRAKIMGAHTEDEMEDLAAALNNGPIRVKLKLVGQGMTESY